MVSDKQYSCPSCSGDVEPHWRACPHCGKKLTGDPDTWGRAQAEDEEVAAGVGSRATAARDWWGRRQRWLQIGLVLLALFLVAPIFAGGCDESTVADVTTPTAEVIEVAAPSTTTEGLTTTTARPTSTEPPTTTTTESGFDVELVRVVDGDTIEARMPDGSVESVRYIGIDTPESVHPSEPVEYMGPEASAYNQRLMEEGPLHLEFDVQERDKYGRLLAYVWAGDVFVNRRLVLDGYAQVSTYPPNVKHESEFLDAQEKARTAVVGLWAPTTTIAPPTSQPPAAEPAVLTVHITKTGEKYHAAGCRYLSKSDIPVSLAEAKARGLGP